MSTYYPSKFHLIFCSLVLTFPALGGMWQSHIFTVFDQFILAPCCRGLLTFIWSQVLNKPGRNVTLLK